MGALEALDEQSPRSDPAGRVRASRRCGWRSRRRPAAPPARRPRRAQSVGLRAGATQADRRKVRVRHRELAAGREGLEQGDGLPRRGLGLSRPAWAPQELGESTEHVAAHRRAPARRQGVLRGPRSRRRTGRRCSRTRPDARACGGAPRPAERLRTGAPGRTARPPRGARRAAPRARRRRARTEDGIGVGHRVGVVREEGEVGRAGAAPPGRAGAARPAGCAAGPPPRRRAGRARAGTPPPPAGDEHARRQRLVERVDRLRGHDLEQCQVGLGRDDGHRVEEQPRPRTEPRRAGQHRVPDRVGDRVGAGASALDDEERVAGGLAVELVGVDTGRLGQHRDRRRERGASVEPPHRPVRRQLAHDGAQRRGPGRARRRGSWSRPARGPSRPCGPSSRTTSSVASSAQCRSSSTRTVVPCARSSRAGPARPRAALRLRSDDRLQRPAHGVGDVEQRAERSRCEQRVARARQDPDVGAGAELPDQCRLAATGLAADDDDRPSGRAPDVVEESGQQVEASRSRSSRTPRGWSTVAVLRSTTLIVRRGASPVNGRHQGGAGRPSSYSPPGPQPPT